MTTTITANSRPLNTYPNIFALSLDAIAAAGVRTLTDLVNALIAEGLTVETMPAAAVDGMIDVDAYAPDGRRFFTMFCI